MSLPVKAISNVPAIAELTAWAQLAKKSGIIPPQINEHQAMAVVQVGREMGLQPFQSLMNMTFINGRLTLSAELMLALAKSKGVKVKELKETKDGCTVTLELNGETATRGFTKDDAEMAGLLGKDNWRKYKQDMYFARAMKRALRALSPHITLGLLLADEAESIEPIITETPASDPPPAEVVSQGEEAEAAEPSNAPDETPPPTTEKKLTPSRIEFYKEMEAFKKGLGEEQYYSILGVMGFEHASDITKKGEARKVKESMQRALDHKKSEDESGLEEV